MKKEIYILSILSVLVFNMSFSQKRKIKDAIKKYENLSYAESKDQLLALATQDDAPIDVIEKLANAYYFNGEMEEASKWYKKLTTIDTETVPENYFRYAQALKAEQRYDEADHVFETFASLNPRDSRGKKFMNNKNYLASIEKVSEDFELENLYINTPFSDFGSSIFNNHLIFASSRDQKGKIYEWNAQPFLDLFKLNESGSVSEVSGDVNSKYHESSSAFTKDGSTIYFTRNNFYKGKFKKSNDNVHGLKIYRATWEDGAWSNVESLPFNNDDYNVAHPALSIDDKKLYFASDMPGTKGGSDIFVVNINDNGTFGTPVNLGDVVNTEGRENFPFVSENGTLYFSSDGHLGLGGLDVFKVKTNDSGLLGVPQNIGKPYNSSRDDFGYIINETSRIGYVSSNRKGGKGDDDVYRFTEPECVKDVTGTAFDATTKDILANTDIVVYDTYKNVLKVLKTDESGQFKFELKCIEQGYALEGKKDGYSDGVKDFSTKADSAPLKVSLELKPKVAEVGTDLFILLDLEPIYFDYDKSFIRTDAEVELDKVIAYMRQYPNVKIDVRSHTDSRGRDAYNLALSQRRNKSTKDYIINKGGIYRDRLTGKGYGETKLTNRCSNGVKCTKAEHQANRRSEFIVIAN